jgi:error-prone DNA polymerase
LRHELEIIHQLGFSDYFLIVWDVAEHARSEGIRFAGRGSAADSAVAYCLGLTEVDSIRRGLLFERFLSLERAQKPDIDFDARYRDDVTQYVYKKYGADRVATVCTFNTYHARSAVRDLGKAMGFPAEEIDRLAKVLPGFFRTGSLEEALEATPALRECGLPLDPFRLLVHLCQKVAGRPRFIGTPLGGVVISGPPLTQVTPLQTAAKGVAIGPFDKNDIEELGLIKLDLLSLRTLSAVQDSLETLDRQGAPLDYSRIPTEDADTFERLQAGETVGVFQLESPAQRALQARLGADRFEDIVASVALIRPGPIEGNMVEPFIARRKGEAPVEYLHPALKPILEKTYGVVLYQEQVIAIATAIAGFTPGESDKLRRVMTHARSRSDMQEIGEEFVRKAVGRGTCPAVAEQVFSYIRGYAGYGFCEARAAAFGDTAYRTAYLMRHHPAAFLAAILSNQPMGYYPSDTLCLEARRRGIGILPPDLNRSGRNFQVEDGAIRVSLRQVRGMKRAALDALLLARRERSRTRH